MGEETAKNLLKEMISNFITQNKKYPQGLDLENQAKFIGSVFGTKLEQGKKEEVIKETRTVLNGLVEAKVNELAAKDYDETNKRSKNPNTIKKLSGLYNLTNATIDYEKRKNSEGKLVENIKEFLQGDEDISKSETLKKLTEEAIKEDTMDGYRNLLKSFRKSYEELVKLKGGETGMTILGLGLSAMGYGYKMHVDRKTLKLEKNDLEHQRKHLINEARIKGLESDLSLVKAFNKDLQKKNGSEQKQIDQLKERLEKQAEKLEKSQKTNRITTITSVCTVVL
ncbi:15488_t:CDS:2, partial [Racocetra persica]